ncbi:hypothetical protein WJX77_005492 [Trebouxia sp. C0004]
MLQEKFEIRMKQTSKQIAAREPGSLYKCSSYQCIFRSICRHLRAERTRVYRATATYPYGVPDMLNTSNPVWVQLRDNINSALQRAMRASEVPPNTTTL